MQKYLPFFLLLSIGVFCQTLTEKQMMNARATGYAVVAAKNPGIEFSVYMIKWDGVGSLESNANSQINPSWHAQAAVKGNYFYQPFDGSDFTYYSSVVTSQEGFDQCKSTGTDWWIVCSTLPAFSNSGGTYIPRKEVNEIVFRNLDTTDDSDPYRLRKVHGSPNNNWLELQLNDDSDESFRIYGNSCAGYGCGEYSQNLYHSFDASGNVYHRGNVGIGIPNPQNKLDVNGTIHSKEVKVDMQGWADYVFKKDYRIPQLEEVERHIATKGSLPGIPSEKEVLQNGINLGDMNRRLLQKVEELTLYSIEQNKKIKKMQEDIEALKQRK